MADLAGHLLEREEALEAVAAVVDGALGGRGGAVVVEARPGLGKTALLEHARACAHAGGAHVLAVRAAEPERGWTFGVALALLGPSVEDDPGLLGGPAALAAPVFGAAGEAAIPDPTPVWHGLALVLRRLALRRRLVVVVDDLQWADGPSAGALAHVARRGEDVPVGLVLASRPVPDTGPAFEDAMRVWLQPLGSDAAARVVRGYFPTAEDMLVATCVAAAAGSPLLLHELCRSLRRLPQPLRAASVQELASEGLARRIGGRLRRLGPDAAALARAVAVLGDPAPLGRAARLAALDVPAAQAAAELLGSEDVLVGGSALSFVHPLVGAAVLVGAAAGRLGRDRARAAQVLREDGEPAARVAGHLLHAPPAGDPAAVATLRAAAGEALADGLPHVAVEHLRRAVAEPPPAAARLAVLQELAHAAAASGAPDAEAHLRTAIAASPDGRGQARLWADVGRLRALRNGPAAAREAFAAGLDALGDLDDDGLRRELRALSAGAGVYDLDDLGEQAVEALLERQGPLTAAERGLLAQAALRDSLTGRVDARRALLLVDRALDEGRLLADEGPEGLHLNLCTGVLLWTDELARCRALATEGRAHAEARGAPLARALAEYLRATPALMMGDPGVALADAEAAYAVLAGTRGVWPAGNLLVLAQCRSEAGAVEEAVVDLREAHARTEGISTVRPMALGALAEQELHAGHAGTALALARAAGEQVAGRADNPAALTAWRSIAARALAALGRREEGEPLAREELALARAWGAPRPAARALTALARTRPAAEAIALLEEAEALLRPSQARLAHGWALHELGAALRRDGRRAAARGPLAEALHLAHERGLVRLEAATRQELLAAGGRPRRPALVGALALTPSERRVADLAAAGHANREVAGLLVVSVKTVEFHLANAFRKLGISERTDLPNALRE